MLQPGASEAAPERILTAALERGLVRDAAIAQSGVQAKAFWRLREEQSAAQKPEGAGWKHDISVPISKVARFIEQASAAMQRLAPGCRVLGFVHVGDGNIHFNVLQPEGGDGPAFDALRDDEADIVHDITASFEGSISAEHGLGAMKTEEALRYKSAAEVEALRAVRAALDPHRIMNPRVLLSQPVRWPVPCVGVVCLRGEEVLLIRRGKAPREGEWSICTGSAPRRG